MTVIRYWTLHAVPGRYDDTLGLLQEAAKMCERHGANEARLSRGLVAGTNSDTLVFSCEFSDFSAFGEFADGFMADSEYDAYLRRVRAADVPFTLVSSALATEVVLDRQNPKNDHGQVIDAYTFRTRPGRLTDSHHLVSDAFDVLDRLGAARCRLFQLGTGGDQVGTHVSTIEFDSMRTWGRTRDAYLADPAGRALGDTANAAESPIEAISHSVYTRTSL